MEKPKVGILSMQRIANYGSFLQAYALKIMLEELGYEVQFVDYHAGKCLVAPDGKNNLTRKLAKIWDTLQIRTSIANKLEFLKYKRNFARNYHHNLGVTQTMNYTPQLDTLVIGSDEVFNCVQSNANVGFSPELFGANRKAKRLISYAASFGNTTFDKLEKYHVRNEVANWLNEFDAISVRDANSGEIVKALTGVEPSYHLDPVLMYDYIGKCTLIPKEVPCQNYLLLYGYSGRFSQAECDEIRKFARVKDLIIVCLGGIQGCCDKFIDANPFEVIAYFQHAAYVVTDTFHGTILAVVAHRQFAVCVRDSGYGNAEKLGDLLRRLKLESRKVARMAGLSGLLDNEIDYKAQDEIIHVKRERAYRYLSIIHSGKNCI